MLGNLLDTYLNMYIFLYKINASLSPLYFADKPTCLLSSNMFKQSFFWRD